MNKGINMTDHKDDDGMSFIKKLVIIKLIIIVVVVAITIMVLNSI